MKRDPLVCCLFCEDDGDEECEFDCLCHMEEE